MPSKITIVGFVLLLMGLLLAILLGATTIHLKDMPYYLTTTDQSLEVLLIRDVRLPRALSVVMVGGILGLAGAMIQGVTRNPIAEPSLLGVTQGATLMVALFISKDLVLNTSNVMLASAFGAAVSGGVMGILLLKPSKQPLAKVLLAGTALSTFFMSLTTVVGLLSNKAQWIAFWVGGGFRTVTWTEFYWVLGVGILGLIVAQIKANHINVLALGDEVAIGVGVNPKKTRGIILILMIVLVAVAVGVGKNIGFVGLIVPQIVRKLVGSNYKRILPLSFLLGATLLTYADIAARVMFAPYEMPIGVFTALIGVPFFLSIARKERG